MAKQMGFISHSINMYTSPWLEVNLGKIFGFVIEQDKSSSRGLGKAGHRIAVDQTLRLQWPNEGVVLAQKGTMGCGDKHFC